VTWSMLGLEEPPTCECKYDETRDEMDREDCPFHCDLVDEVSQRDAQPVQRKKTGSAAAGHQEDAA
jgi:hypothetical protein